MRAAEVGFALARAGGTRPTVMAVADPPAPRREAMPRRAATPEADALKTVTSLAGRFEVEPQTVFREAEDKAAAVLGQARRGGATLIVLGVVSRAGTGRPFGSLAHSLLDGSDHALLLIVHESVGGGPAGNAARA